MGYQIRCPSGYSLNSSSGLCVLPNACPEGQSMVGGVCKEPEQCPEGTVLQNGECVDNECKGGRFQDLKIKLGWGRYSAGSGGHYAVKGGGSVDLVGSLAGVPANVCYAGCQWSNVDNDSAIFVDTADSVSGHHALVTLAPYVSLDKKCGADTDLDLAKTPPSCDGYLGNVNGKEVCLKNPEDNSPCPEGEVIVGYNKGNPVCGPPPENKPKCSSSEDLAYDVVSYEYVCVKKNPNGPKEPGQGGGGTGGGGGGGTGGGGNGNGAGNGGGTGTGSGGGGGGGNGTSGGGGGGNGGGTGGGGNGDNGNGSEGDDEKPRSSWGGTCVGFNCKGDAVQCAIARELHEQYCRYNKPGAESGAYDNATSASGASGDKSILDRLPGNKTIELGPDRWDMTDRIGGASCIRDLTVTVAGQTVELPLSRVCPYLEWLGRILIFLTAIVCVKIVTYKGD